MNNLFSRRPQASLSLPAISLMWPGEIPPGRPETGTAWFRDLGVEALVRALSSNRRYLPFIRQALAALYTDTDVIAWRLAVLQDLLANPAVVDSVEKALPMLADIQHGHSLLGKRERNLLMETSDRLAELDIYVTLVDELAEVLAAAELQSEALQRLRSNLKALHENPEFASLRDQLPALREPLESVASLTVGINLDRQLQPKSVILLSINDYELGDRFALLDRLIGRRDSGDGEAGIAPLHVVPRDPELRPYSALFQDLNHLMTQAARPVAKALQQYTQTHSAPLANLEFELAFFVSAVRFIQRLQGQGVVFCRPEAEAMEARLSEAEGLANVNLAMHEVPVASNARFDDEGRIAILTGPNSGGKTTYLRALGLAQVLFQAGLYVPAARARFSPVDAIFTHFPVLETQDQGRLAEESSRLRTIFEAVTPYSLVLLNETFSSTTSGEAVYLAQDVLAGLRAIGARAIFATHLVELAQQLQHIESLVEGESTLCSLVAGIEVDGAGHAQPTFKIDRGQPHMRSYARQIANHHGITLEQLRNLSKHDDLDTSH